MRERDLIRNMPKGSIINGIDDLNPNCIKKTGRFLSIVIPKGIMMINCRAFIGCCRYLKSIEISESVVIIDKKAFAHCDCLDTISVNSNNKVYDSRNNCNAIIRSKDNKLIFGCKASIIPNGVKSIDKDAFSHCHNLTSLIIPESLQLFNFQSIHYKEALKTIKVDRNNSIYDSRDNCNAVIRSSDSSLILACNYSIIPDGIKIIGDSAFCNCTELKNVSVPNGVIEISDNAFSNCHHLEKINLPNTVVSIGIRAFEACSSLETVTLPQGLSNISESAFENCSKLSKIIIKDGLKFIGSYAFCGCQKLEEVYLPDSIESVGESIFYPHSLIKRILISKGSRKKFEFLLSQYKELLVEVTKH